jgi:hypothetical protein
MTYNTALPRIDNIRWLKTLARPFPVTAGEILETAKLWKFGDSTTDFLELFPADVEFENEEDFITSTENLEIMIREKRDMPVERLYSPEE